MRARYIVFTHCALGSVAVVLISTSDLAGFALGVVAGIIVGSVGGFSYYLGRMTGDTYARTADVIKAVSNAMPAMIEAALYRHERNREGDR